MPMDPSARLILLEKLRRSGVPVGPESLSDGLEGAATPLDADPMAGEAVAPPPDDNAELFARQEARAKTDDYRRERALYRVAKATGTPVEELMQQPEWAGVGEARADSAIVPMQARAAMAQKRMDGEAERMERWKSQMLLASSNSRANMSNAFGLLSPEQQQRVIESRLTGNRYNNNNDPRMAIAQLEAETRRAEGKEARASQAEIAEANRLAAREERDAVRESEERRYGAQQEESRQRHEALMKQKDNETRLMLEKMTAGQVESAQRHAETIEGLKAQIETNRQNAEARSSSERYAADKRVEEAEVNAGVLKEKLGVTEQQLEDKAKQMATEQQLAISERAFGPGVRDIAGKQYDNPAAVETLASIAEQANKSWTGFWEADAQRMDAILHRLGVTDPTVRHRLVEEHGLNARGRASVPSYYFHGTPRYATYDTPAAP